MNHSDWWLDTLARDARTNITTGMASGMEFYEAVATARANSHSSPEMWHDVVEHLCSEASPRRGNKTADLLSET